MVYIYFSLTGWIFIWLILNSLRRANQTKYSALFRFVFLVGITSFCIKSSTVLTSFNISMPNKIWIIKGIFHFQTLLLFFFLLLFLRVLGLMWTSETVLKLLALLFWYRPFKNIVTPPPPPIYTHTLELQLHDRITSVHRLIDKVLLMHEGSIILRQVNSLSGNLHLQQRTTAERQHSSVASAFNNAKAKAKLFDGCWVRFCQLVL